MQPGRRRLGVLGGSFNPPHLGHLALASVACGELGLERVVFVPAATPPHKVVADDTPAAVRFALTEAATEEDMRFAVSSVEIDRDLAYTREVLDGAAPALRGRRVRVPHGLGLAAAVRLVARSGGHPRAGRSGGRPAAGRRLERQSRPPCVAGGRSGCTSWTCLRWASRPRTCGVACARACPSATWCRSRWRTSSASSVCSESRDRPGRSGAAAGGAPVAEAAGAHAPGRRRGRVAGPAVRRLASTTPSSPGCCTTSAASSPPRRSWRRRAVTASPSAQSRRGAR